MLSSSVCKHTPVAHNVNCIPLAVGVAECGIRDHKPNNSKKKKKDNMQPCQVSCIACDQHFRSAKI